MVEARDNGVPRVLVVAEPGGLGAALVRRLAERGATGEVVAPASDAQLSTVLVDGEWDALAVVTRDDVLALRLTLLCGHVRPELPLWVTLFDATLTHRLRALMPAVHIVSTAHLVAQELADLCCQVAEPAPRWRHGVRMVDGALRLLVGAGAGLLAAFVVQAVITIAALHQGVVDSIYYSTRAIATVADVPAGAQTPAWFKIVSALDTIAALVFVAVFTAALVRRLSHLRLTTLLGRRCAPARGHVVLVGFGQVGFRLAQALRERRIAVVAVERAADAPYVRMGHEAGIPIALGRGDDRATLELVGVRRCAAVAAVTSEDLINVAIGLAATDVRPGVAVALRLGDGGVASETESLLHLGMVADGHHLAAVTLAEAIAATVNRSPGREPLASSEPGAR